MKTPVQMVCAVASMEVVNFVYSRNVFPAILNTFGGLFPVSVLIDLLIYNLFDVLPVKKATTVVDAADAALHMAVLYVILEGQKRMKEVDHLKELLADGVYAFLLIFSMFMGELLARHFNY